MLDELFDITLVIEMTIENCFTRQNVIDHEGECDGAAVKRYIVHLVESGAFQQMDIADCYLKKVIDCNLVKDVVRPKIVKDKWNQEFYQEVGEDEYQ